VTAGSMMDVTRIADALPERAGRRALTGYLLAVAAALLGVVAGTVQYHPLRRHRISRRSVHRLSDARLGSGAGGPGGFACGGEVAAAAVGTSPGPHVARVGVALDAWRNRRRDAHLRGPHSGRWGRLARRRVRQPSAASPALLAGPEVTAPMGRVPMATVSALSILAASNDGHRRA
jgi:hypothetical protein